VVGLVRVPATALAAQDRDARRLVLITAVLSLLAVTPAWGASLRICKQGCQGAVSTCRNRVEDGCGCRVAGEGTPGRAVGDSAGCWRPNTTQTRCLARSQCRKVIVKTCRRFGSNVCSLPPRAARLDPHRPSARKGDPAEVRRSQPSRADRTPQQHRATCLTRNG